MYCVVGSSLHRQEYQRSAVDTGAGVADVDTDAVVTDVDTDSRVASMVGLLELLTLSHTSPANT